MGLHYFPNKYPAKCCACGKQVAVREGFAHRVAGTGYGKDARQNQYGVSCAGCKAANDLEELEREESLRQLHENYKKRRNAMNKKTETKAMSLGDHMRRFDEEVDALAEIAHRIDEELIRIEFNKPPAQRERPSRWPGAYIDGYPRPRFQPNMGELKAGAAQSWQAAWLGEVESRFDKSPLLRPLFQQYAEKLAGIEMVLNMGLTPVPSQLEWSPPQTTAAQALDSLAKAAAPRCCKAIETLGYHEGDGPHWP